MSLALLIVFLVNGEIRADVMGAPDCLRIAAAVREGKRVVIHDADGNVGEVEIARCILDLEDMKERPTS